MATPVIGVVGYKNNGKTRQMPIIMLTAKSEEIDAVVGLDAGHVDVDVAVGTVTTGAHGRFLLARLGVTTGGSLVDASTLPLTIGFMMGSIVLAGAFATRNVISRLEGLVLLAFYASFLWLSY